MKTTFHQSGWQNSGQVWALLTFVFHICIVKRVSRAPKADRLIITQTGCSRLLVMIIIMLKINLSSPYYQSIHHHLKLQKDGRNIGWAFQLRQIRRDGMVVCELSLSIRPLLHSRRNLRRSVETTNLKFLHVFHSIKTNEELIRRQREVSARALANSVLPTPVGPKNIGTID